jgi:tetratricopeptide (TPR) repeat protein
MLSSGVRPGSVVTPEHEPPRSTIETPLFGDSDEVVGRYRLLHRIGEGGMGAVHAAYDDRLDRKIAIKLIHPSRSGNAQLRARMLVEARALARLSHPNVVHVYEVGEVDDGQLFVAMEFLAGPTLRGWLDERRRSWQAIVQVFRQAGEGLAAAHAIGIVHRDFKPDNVMFGDDERVRVTDFGLARVEGSADLDSTLDPAGDEPVHMQTGALTRTGMLMGTPGYMASELFAGKPADSRSDQYAFCVTLYEALYGERPFAGSTIGELTRNVAAENIRPAPAGSAVPSWLRKVVVRGLAKTPSERWPSMRELLAALADDPAVRRRQWVASAMAVVMLGGGAWGVTDAIQREQQVCAGMGENLDGVWDAARRAELHAAFEGTELSYASATWERVEQRLDEYTQQWVAARTEACEATHQGEQSGELLDLRMACLDERLSHVRATVDVLAQADATVVREAVQAVMALPSLDRCADVNALRAEVPPPEDPAAAERVAALTDQLVSARALLRAGRYEQGLAIADAVVLEAEAIGYEPLQARAWFLQGDLQRQLGRYELAEATLERAYGAALGLQMADEAASASSTLMFLTGHTLARYQDARRWAKDAGPLARAAGTDDAMGFYLRNLGTVAQAEGKREEARGYLEQALRELEADDPEQLQVAATLLSLGNVATMEGKFQEARGYQARALALFERLLGPEHPHAATALSNLSKIALEEGNHAEAREHLERAVAIIEKALGPDHPDLGMPLGILGDVARREGKFAESRQYQERALAIKEKALGPDHPDIASSLGNLGVTARAEGKYAEARVYLERSLAIVEKAQPGQMNVGVALTSLGNLAREEGKYEEARQHYERALAIWEKALGPDHRNVGLALMNLGNLAEVQEKYDEAHEYMLRGQSIWEKALGPDHPNLAGAATSLGRVLLARGRPADALAQLERAASIYAAKKDLDPIDVALTHFALAQALWEAPDGEGRDRARARTLAEQARVAYANAGERSAKELQEVLDWQRQHAE